MELAYQGEITTPSRCGRMDQGCAFGNRPVLMTFDGDRLDTEELQVSQELYYVIVDLHAKKDTLEILKKLNRCYPIAENEVERGVQELLGPINKRIVRQSIEALRAGDAERLGALMAEAQAFFDRYATPACPEELTSPTLHKVLSYEPLSRISGAAKASGRRGWHRAVYHPQRDRPAGRDRDHRARPGNALPQADAQHRAAGAQGGHPGGGIRDAALPGLQGHQERDVPHR
jgi:galactokinase